MTNISGSIYCITNLVNGKQYVGMTRLPLHLRFRTHRSIKSSGAPLLKKAFVKYGIDNFKFEKIDFANSVKDLGDKEIYWIKTLKTLAPSGYNILPGGHINIEAAKANRVPIIHLDTGQIFESMAEAAKILNIPSYNIGNVCLGKQDSASGNRFEYLNLELAKKAETVRKNRHCKFDNPVLNLDSGELYPSVKEAAKTLNVSLFSLKHYLYGTGKMIKNIKLTFLKRRSNGKRIS